MIRLLELEHVASISGPVDFEVYAPGNPKQKKLMLLAAQGIDPCLKEKHDLSFRIRSTAHSNRE